MTVTRWNPEMIYSQIASAYKQAAAVAVAEAKVKAPSATGELRRSITYIPTGLLSGVITTPVKHGAAQEKGAGPHTIAPVRKKALYNKRSGFGPVFGAVQHPGNPGVGYLQAGAEAFRVAFVAAIKARFFK